MTGAEPTSADEPSPGSRLCLSCGLCCQGLLHQTAKLQPSELPLAAELGLTVARPRPDQLGFVLPCRHHVGNRCTVYDRRPGACHSYRCHLLRRLEAGEIELEPALDLVARARVLAERVGAAVGHRAGAARLWDSFARWLGETPAAAPAVRLDAGELMALLKREFELRDRDQDW